MSSIDRLYKVLRNVSTETNTAPSQIVSLKVRTLDPLEFTHNDKLVISKEFYKLDKNFSSADLEIGDFVSAMMLNDGQTYYLLANVSGGGGGSGTNNYNDLENKPSINNVTLKGNKTAADLGIVVPTKISQLTNDSGFVEDNNYHHTDNNYTNSEKTKLANLDVNAAPNIIETIKVNGTTQTVTNKTVDISVPTNNNQLTNGAGYQTASDVASAIANKQDTLTAGANITISDNVISATGGGTTYTAGTNINITNDVISTVAEVNAIDTIKVNGTAQTITNKTVDLSISDSTIPDINITNGASPTNVTSYVDKIVFVNAFTDSTSPQQILSLFYVQDSSTLIGIQARLSNTGVGYVGRFDYRMVDRDFKWVYSTSNLVDKVTSISSSSTDLQVPSAKLLYDQLALKQDIITPISTAEINALFS